MKTEQEIQKEISKNFESKGYWVLKIMKSNKNGCPDLLCVKKDHTFFVEVKKRNGIISELQKFRIKELRKVGVEAYAMDGINSIIF